MNNNFVISKQPGRHAEIRLPFSDFSYIATYIVCILFLLQFAFSWQWQALSEWQSNFYYRQLSGFAIALLLYLQWRLMWLRSSPNREKSIRALKRHRWQGVILVVLIYLHANNLGYAYQNLLVIAMLLNVALGPLNPKAVNYVKAWYVNIWFMVHICLASLCTIMLLYHIYIVYTFN